MIIPLFESRNAVADATGNVTLRFSPGTAGASWDIRRMVTSITGGGVTPRTVIQMAVYRNVVSEATKLDGTSSAAQDTSEIPNGIPVPSSDTILVLYSGVPVGASCSFTISGTVDTGRN